MSRITDRVLIQWVDGAGAVVMDDSTGEEIVIPPEAVPAAIQTLSYFLEASR